MEITNQVLNKLSIAELRELNSNVVRILKSKVANESANAVNNYNIGNTVVYIGRGKINGQQFEVKKINKVNLVCENLESGQLWNLKANAVELVD